MARKERIPGGLASGRKPSDFPRAALAKGTKVELEHVVRPGRKPTARDRQLAREIAMDHLAEDLRYYDFLERAERSMKATRWCRRFMDLDLDEREI